MRFVSIRPEHAEKLTVLIRSPDHTQYTAIIRILSDSVRVHKLPRSPINGQRAAERLLATVRRLREQMVDFLGADVVCGWKISGQVTVLSSQPTGGLSPAFREAIKHTESVPATIKWTDAEAASILLLLFSTLSSSIS